MAINALRTTSRYRDFSNNLTVHPVSEDISPITDDVAIKQSIKNIVMTDFGERPFNPEFGCGIRGLLFENIEPSTEVLIREKIFEAIERFEPRCRLIEVYVSSSPDNNSVNISIVFSIINNPEPITLDVILYRVR